MNQSIMALRLFKKHTSNYVSLGHVDVERPLGGQEWLRN